MMKLYDEYNHARLVVHKRGYNMIDDFSQDDDSFIFWIWKDGKTIVNANNSPVFRSENAESMKDAIDFLYRITSEQQHC